MISHFPRLLDLAASGGALVVHSALKASLILLVMSALLLWGRRFSAALRHTLWVLTCLSVLILPLMTVVLPAWQPPFARPTPTPATPTSQVVEAEDKAVQEEPSSPFLRPLAAGHTQSGAFKIPSDMGQITLALCLGIWLIGASYAALRYCLGAITLRRVLHHSEPVQEGAIAAEYQTALHSLGFAAPNFGTPRLFIADDAKVSVPVTWGALRPLVLLPHTALQWSETCRSAALLHELSHVKRGDWLTQSLASLVSVIYWFHPLVWFVARQLRLESERATDDRVLATGLAAPDYSSFLIEIVRLTNARHRGSMLKVTVPIVGSSRLEARLRSILDPRRNRGNVSRKLAVTLALITVSTVLSLASVRASGGTAPPTTIAQPSATHLMNKPALRWVIPRHFWMNTLGPVWLGGLKGKVTVIEFFRIGCSHCQEAASARQELYLKYRSQGLRMVGIQSPTPYDGPQDAENNWNQVQREVRKWKLTYPVGFDTGGALFAKYKLASYPTILVIDRQGTVRFQQVGYTPAKAQQLEQFIAQALKSPGVTVPTATVTQNATRALLQEADKKQPSLATIEQLVAQGADVNASLPSGYTPLILTVFHDDIPGSQFLLEHGAKANARDITGNTSILHATFSANTALVKLLLAHGANPNDRALDGSNRRALGLAVSRNEPLMVAALLARGANPNAKQNMELDGIDTPMTALEYLRLRPAHWGYEDTPYGRDQLRREAQIKHLLLQAGAKA